ncbi:hypothetical protein XU06_29685 (plasmid) [Rhodococcus erythropolis]|uniref:acyl-CoA thioesterase n=1 Tax=Rhodococcus erythropolis TaxID=1833 RepID=UPI00061B7499|nr:acyl-CoA thioesterase domain-containing protein [Rhodococcus erythropolis]AKE01135.1 hypothetical protein XU06_29685 [Rhodococcus erythropolis]
MTATLSPIIGTPGSSAAMLAALDLTPSSDAQPDVFVARHQRIPSGRAYGGELLAHAVAAIDRTIGQDWEVHSIHGYFLRAADVEQPSNYSVKRVRDGRSFAVRSVTSEQSGRQTFTATASCRKAGVLPGPNHSPKFPDLPDPESLPTSAESVAGTDVRDTDYWALERNFDVRHVDEPVYVTKAESRSAAQVVWVRAFSRLPDAPAIHRQAIAYICDYTLLEPALRAHGAAWSDEGLMTASLDHAMWFHADVRADEWIALVQEAPHFADQLATTSTHLFTRDGRLVATVAQQGLVRLL